MYARAIIRVYYKANRIDVNVYMFRIIRGMYDRKSNRKSTSSNDITSSITPSHPAHHPDFLSTIIKFLSTIIKKLTFFIKKIPPNGHRKHTPI